MAEGFFKRMFSADFRRAVAAEAAGDYAEAARAYALAGERAKVAEMHLLRAERAPSPAAKLQELRAAVRWADVHDPAGRQARRRIARALYSWARAATLLGDAERQVARDAAGLFAEVGDHSGAGECHEFIGDEQSAAEAYQRAGDLERLESVLQREEARRRRRNRISDAYEEYRLALAGGERDRALEAIRLCAEAPPSEHAEPLRDRASYRQLREELEARLIVDGRVTLRVHGPQGAAERRFAGGFPLVLGRAPACQLILRDVGISREHAEIAIEPEAGYAVADRRSQNGTTLNGVRIAGRLPLGDDGELGLGGLCLVGYRVRDGRVRLEVTRGLDRGLVLEAAPLPLEVDEVAELAFVDGRPRLHPLGGRLLYLNGVHAGGAVQLIRGDVVEVGERRLEVLA